MICELADTILAIEPPAKAFAFIISSTPSPIIKPPKIEANSIFEVSGSKVKRFVNKSIKKDIKTIAIIVLIAKNFPKYFPPQISYINSNNHRTNRKTS